MYQLSKIQKIVFDLIKENPEIKNKEIVEKSGVPAPNVTRAINGLKEKGFIQNRYEILREPKEEKDK